MKQSLILIALCLIFGTLHAQNHVVLGGKKLSASAPCEDSNNFSISLEDGSMVVVINSPDAGSTAVDDKFFTEDCVTCPIVQLMAADGEEYRAVSGTLFHEGKKVGFKVKLQAASNASLSLELSGEVLCE